MIIDQATIDRAYDETLFLSQREIYEGSLYQFVQDAWPYIDNAKFLKGWAIEALCDHLEAVTLGYIPRLLVNMPPRAGKTLLTSVAWPAWVWARRKRTFLSGPQVRFLWGSYNDNLALISATNQRRLVLSPFYQRFWGNRFSLSADQAAKSNFSNTEGGARISTSVGGSLLGLGGDIIGVDDPHNLETEKAIETDTDRKRVASWWRELSGTRLNDPKQSAIVVNMQRLHQEDLSGIILENEENFTHLMIPMHWDEGRRIHTIRLPQYESEEAWTDPRAEDGELMWPERFGETEVKRMEQALGPYMASGRLEQIPSPKGGGIIKDIWWRLWDTEVAAEYGREWTGGRKEFPEMSLVCASLDTAYKEKEENDYNAMTVWGVWQDKNRNPRAMLMYAWQKRLPMHGELLDAMPHETKLQFEMRQKEKWGLIEWVADTCKRYKVKRLFIEDKSRGYDVAQEINRLYARENWGVQLLNPVGDKVSRGHSVVPMFTDGIVWAPNTKWAEMTIVQCASVPKASHDDLYDTVTMFLHWARENGLLQRGDEVTAAIEEEKVYRPRTMSVQEQYGV